MTDEQIVQMNKARPDALDQLYILLAMIMEEVPFHDEDSYVEVSSALEELEGMSNEEFYKRELQERDGHPDLESTWYELNQRMHIRP